jgi:hypothetical protein
MDTSPSRGQNGWLRPGKPGRGVSAILGQVRALTPTLRRVIREQWDGTEWQEHCRRLLAARFGTEIQFIPDRDRGDGGLEAYSFDGTGYQCYAPMEAYSTGSLTSAQKAKISTDVAKLTKNPTRTKALLGTVVLGRWVLLTPDFDSRELVEYARAKSEKVRDDPEAVWCDEHFEIVIATDEIFAVERAALYGQLAGGVYLDLPDPEDDDLFAAASGGTAERLVEKLLQEPTFASDEVSLGRYKSSILIDYVRGQQQLELLANDYSAVHAAIQRRFGSTLRGLARELAGTPGAGPVVVQTLMRRLADGVYTDAPGLAPLLCEELARYAVALWFVECPVYFRVAA